MPRKIDDVIIPERKRTIRDIPIPERSRRDEKLRAPTSHHSFSEEKKKGKRSRKRLWIAGGFALVVIAFAVLSIFNGATLSYVPKSSAISFSGDIYTARKTGNSFSYSVVRLSKEKEKSVPASGTQEVSRKASGTIVVYNNASAEPQRLVENTRFQTSDGKVFRIQDTISVPGKKGEPGSLEVMVYADQAGESYNIGLSDFTLPGLAGTARAETIYARSKTPMSGGFVGREAVVKAEDKAKAETELQAGLREELILEAKAQVPEGFILFPSLVSVVFESLPTSAATGASSANVKVRASFAGAMFKESDLSSELAKSKLTLKAGELVDVIPIESIEINFAGSAPRDLVNSDEINLSVTGQATAVWRTDELALRSDLAGRHKKEISSILNNYPTVVSASATVRPFWKSAFPSDSNKITIKKLPVN